MIALKLGIVIFAFLLSGCASGGELSIHVIPDNTEDYFLQRYYFLTEGGTRICLESDVVAGGSSVKEIKDKDYKKLSSDQRKVCAGVFWKDRDPNPLTPENENKIVYDKRIEEVKSEALFLVP